jgi:FkbM family methyltransferase
VDEKLISNFYKLDYDLVLFKSHFYFLPAYAKHRPACQAILRGNYYEPDTHIIIDLLMKSRPGNLIHAGTFYGDMLPSFSGKCPKTIYAFEPVLENYILAKLCIFKNNLKNVALFNSGLGNQIGISCVETHDVNKIHKGGTSTISSKGQTTTITTIDSFSIDELSVIQLDVEGYELPALMGAALTIERNKPTILIEDNSNNCAPLLNKFGYVFIGRIPGLHIWSHHRDVASIKQILSDGGFINQQTHINE